MAEKKLEPGTAAVDEWMKIRDTRHQDALTEDRPGIAMGNQRPGLLRGKELRC